VCITTYQRETKSNPIHNPIPNPTAKQHSIVNIQVIGGVHDREC